MQKNKCFERNEMKWKTKAFQILCVITVTWLETGPCVNVHKLEDFMNIYIYIYI